MRATTILKANPTRVALVAAGAAALVSSVLYSAQGGFGGGHGLFDLPIVILGLPWDMIIAQVPDSLWPPLFWYNDFSWLIATPLLLNLSAVFAIRGLVRRVRRWSTSKQVARTP